MSCVNNTAWEIHFKTKIILGSKKNMGQIYLKYKKYDRVKSKTNL